MDLLGLVKVNEVFYLQAATIYFLRVQVAEEERFIEEQKVKMLVITLIKPISGDYFV